jgi:3-deoxy-7-phosphoheptulonate synthase
MKEDMSMVVVLKPDTKAEQIENLKAWLKSLGITTHISQGVNHTIIGLVGDTSVVDMDLIRALDMVENVQRIQEPFKNANRKFSSLIGMNFLCCRINGKASSNSI